MASKLTFQSQIQTLKHQLSETEFVDPTAMDIEIDRIARGILQTPIPPEEQKQMLGELLKLRVQLVHHIPIKGLTDTLYLNLIQDAIPSPICPAYGKMGFPTVTTYHQIGPNISCVRLDPKGLEFVPNPVLEEAGPLEGKQVDLLWTAVDGRFYGFNRSLNHSSHSWAHRHALPGPEHSPHSDISFDIDVGLFPELGYQNSAEPGAIAMNRISPMKVHVHAPQDLRNVKPGDMLYSPDNSHFRALPGTPFGIDWSVTKKDDRIAITKRIVIFDYNHPISDALLDSMRSCPDLNEHLKRLAKVPHAIQKTFLPLIEAFEKNEPMAMQAFHELPLAFQNGIYREAWISFGSPEGIHGDFGKASFENQPGLDQIYHCGNPGRAEAVRNFCKRLEYLLVGSQFELLFQAQSLVKGDNILNMMKSAELFKKDPQAGLEAFHQTLSEEEKGAVYFAFWELSGCPRLPNFGTHYFPLNTEDQKAVELKIQAILLAASRQTPKFATPVLEDPLLKTTPLVFEEMRSTKHRFAEYSLDFSPLVDKQQEEKTDPIKSLVRDEIMNLVFSNPFPLLEKSRRAEQVNTLLLMLESGNRNLIYKRIYNQSHDSKKGGPSWAENHVADDLELLTNILQEELN
jgi:hypothetical protein